MQTKKKLSPMQRIQKEDEINDWLEQNGLHGNNVAGETFVEAGFTGEDLESIRNDAGKEAFIQVLLWIENLLSSQRVIKDLEEASTRISHLGWRHQESCAHGPDKRSAAHRSS